MSIPPNMYGNRPLNFNSPPSTPTKSPKPLSTSLIPGAVVSPVETRLPRVKRLQQTSPSRKSTIVPGGKEPISPATKAAHDKLRKQARVKMSKPRTLATRLFEAVREKRANPKPQQKEDSWLQTVIHSPIVNPARGNTQVFAEGTKQYAKHTRRMQRIAHIQANSISDVRGMGGARQLFTQHLKRTDNPNAPYSRHPNAYRAQRQAQIADQKEASRTAVLDQERHYRGWASQDIPQNERVLTTEQVHQLPVDPSLDVDMSL